MLETRWARRPLLRSLAAAPFAGAPGARGADRARTLVLGLDIGDAAGFDPARQVNYSPPLTLAACYDTLVTLLPGQYGAVVPCLAAAWERTPDGRGWRFTLRPEAVFESGNRVGPEDCVFSLERLLAIGDPPSHYLDNIAGVVASGPDTVDILLEDPARPLLPYLCGQSYAILEQAALEQAAVRAQGGTALPNAASADRASDWLAQHSAGSGPYRLAAWQRRGAIQLDANPRSWRGPPGFDRIEIRHIQDSTAQLRAVQRGDVDAAFNLLPEQLDLLQTDGAVRIETTRSLDLVYLALTGNPDRHPALALPQARQAIGYAIDYDDLIGRRLGGRAGRPATFLPIGLPGSTEQTAREIGFRQDLDLARRLLAEAGHADGFGFELAYADSAIAGLPYDALARKLRTDLARVGIALRPAPMSPLAWRDAFFGGRLQAALAFWTSPVVENGFWARAALDRLAPRLGAPPPAALRELVRHAETEADPNDAAALWFDYQKAMVSLAHEIVLFQPDYQVAVRRSVAVFPLTAAGWMAELDDVRAAASP